jgi:hypothetical protein
LLLLILGSESAPRALLFDLYHNLGDRMLSKLTNPLVLSNHCLERFTRDSALQI